MVCVLKKNATLIIFLLIICSLNIFFINTNDNFNQGQNQKNFDNENPIPLIANDAVNLSTLSHEIPHYPNANISMLHHIENASVIAHETPFTQTITLLILCVDFPNKDHSLSIGEIEERFDSATENDLEDYWSEISATHLELNFDIRGWYTAPQNVEYYATTGSGLYDEGLLDLVYDTYCLVDDDVDFSNYLFEDMNGEIRSFIGFIFPGWCQSFGQIYSGDTPDRELWSCKWELPMNIDGVTLNNFFITSEFPNTLGIATHEFGHMLGLADLYDLTSSILKPKGAGIGEWGLMGYGGRLGFINNDMSTWGSSPGHLSAYCKIQLGWVDLQTIKVSLEDNDVEIDVLQPGGTTFPRVYKILKDLGGTEYYLLEVRFQISGSFDYYIPDEGLLILHVEESHDQKLEGGYKVDVEENEAIQDLEEYNNLGDIDDCWDVDDEFSPTTNPNSNWYGGVNSEVSIEVISIIDDEKITVRISAPEPPEPPVVIGFPETVIFTIIIIGLTTLIVKKKVINSMKKSNF